MPWIKGAASRGWVVPSDSCQRLSHRPAGPRRPKRTDLLDLAGLGAPTVAELAELGVRRVSVGSSIAQVAYGLVRRATRELLSTGSYESLERDIDYAELNRLVAAR